MRCEDCRLSDSLAYDSVGFRVAWLQNGSWVGLGGFGSARLQIDDQEYRICSEISSFSLG